MIQKNKIAIKSIAFILSFTMILSDLLYAAPVDGVRHFAVLNDPSQFEAPLHFSNLNEIHSTTGQSKTFIIHIQDAHANLSGQQNLAGALDEIMTKYAVKLVLVEGGSKDDTLTPLKSIATPDVWKKVAKKFLIEGKISGEEYLNLTSDHPMKIMGIEDKELYMQSLKTYAELAQKRETILLNLKKVQSALDKLKKKYYPVQLLNYEKLAAKDVKENDNFEAGFKQLVQMASKDMTATFPNVQKLISVQSQESQIDFDKANLEQAALIERLSKAGAKNDIDSALSLISQTSHHKLSQLNFIESIFRAAKEKNIFLKVYPELLRYQKYLTDFSGIDFESLPNEKERLEDEVYRVILSSPQSFSGDQPDSRQKTAGMTNELAEPRSRNDGRDALLIRCIDRYLGLLDSAYHIQMSTREFDTFKVNEPDFATAAYLAFVNRKLADNGYFDDMLPYEAVFDDAKASLEAFYESVSKRDFAFMQNAQRILKEESATEALSDPSSGQKTSFGGEVAVLIAGGYHTTHLKKLFRERGFSYAVLSPIVTSETNQAKYEKILLEPIKKNIKTVTASVDNVSLRSASILAEKQSDLEEDLVYLKKKSEGARQQALAENGARLAEIMNYIKSADNGAWPASPAGGHLADSKSIVGDGKTAASEPDTEGSGARLAKKQPGESPTPTPENGQSTKSNGNGFGFKTSQIIKEDIPYREALATALQKNGNDPKKMEVLADALVRMQEGTFSIRPDLFPDPEVNQAILRREMPEKKSLEALYSRVEQEEVKYRAMKDSETNEALFNDDEILRLLYQKLISQNGIQFLRDDGFSKTLIIAVVDQLSNFKKTWPEVYRPVWQEIVGNDTTLIALAAYAVLKWRDPRATWDEIYKPIRDELVKQGLSVAEATRLVFKKDWFDNKEAWGKNYKPIRDEFLEGCPHITPAILREATYIVTRWPFPKSKWALFKLVREELVKGGLDKFETTRMIARLLNPQNKLKAAKASAERLQTLLTESASTLEQLQATLFVDSYETLMDKFATKNNLNRSDLEWALESIQGYEKMSSEANDRFAKELEEGIAAQAVSPPATERAGARLADEGKVDMSRRNWLRLASRGLVGAGLVVVGLNVGLWGTDFVLKYRIELKKNKERSYSRQRYHFEIRRVTPELLQAIENRQLEFISTVNPFSKRNGKPIGLLVIDGRIVSPINKNSARHSMQREIGVLDKNRLDFYDNQKYSLPDTMPKFAFQSGPLAVHEGNVNENIFEWHRGFRHGRARVLGVDADGDVHVRTFSEFFGFSGDTSFKEHLQAWQIKYHIQDAIFVDGGLTGVGLLEQRPPFVLIGVPRSRRVAPVTLLGARLSHSLTEFIRTRGENLNDEDLRAIQSEAKKFKDSRDLTGNIFYNHVVLNESPDVPRNILNAVNVGAEELSPDRSKLYQDILKMLRQHAGQEGIAGKIDLTVLKQLEQVEVKFSENLRRAGSRLSAGSVAAPSEEANLSDYLKNRLVSKDDFLKDAVSIVLGLLLVLEALHKTGMTHNNIKLENVLADRNDDGGYNVRLAGLGNALAQQGGIDRAPIFDDIADVGVVLNQLLMYSDSNGEFFKKIPRPIRKVIKKAVSTSKDPSDHYTSAADMYRALKKAAKDSGIRTDGPIMARGARLTEKPFLERHNLDDLRSRFMATYNLTDDDVEVKRFEKMYGEAAEFYLRSLKMKTSLFREAVRLVMLMMEWKQDLDLIQAAFFYPAHRKGISAPSVIIKNHSRLYARVNQVLQISQSQPMTFSSDFDNARTLPNFCNWVAQATGDSRTFALVAAVQLTDFIWYAENMIRSGKSVGVEDARLKELLAAYSTLAGKSGLSNISSSIRDQVYQTLRPGEYFDVISEKVRLLGSSEDIQDLEALQDAKEQGGNADILNRDLTDLSLSVDRVVQRRLDDLAQKLQTFLKEKGIEVRVESRVKSDDAIAEKVIIRENKHDYVESIPDLLGLIIIAHSTDDISRVLDAMDQWFEEWTDMKKEDVEFNKGDSAWHLDFRGVFHGSKDIALEVNLMTEARYHDYRYGGIQHEDDWDFVLTHFAYSFTRGWKDLLGSEPVSRFRPIIPFSGKAELDFSNNLAHIDGRTYIRLGLKENGAVRLKDVLELSDDATIADVLVMLDKSPDEFFLSSTNQTITQYEIKKPIRILPKDGYLYVAKRSKKSSLRQWLKTHKAGLLLADLRMASTSWLLANWTNDRTAKQNIETSLKSEMKIADIKEKNIIVAWMQEQGEKYVSTNITKQVGNFSKELKLFAQDKGFPDERSLFEAIQMGFISLDLFLKEFVDYISSQRLVLPSLQIAGSLASPSGGLSRSTGARLTGKDSLVEEMRAQQAAREKEIREWVDVFTASDEQAMQVLFKKAIPNRYDGRLLEQNTPMIYEYHSKNEGFAVEKISSKKDDTRVWTAINFEEFYREGLEKIKSIAHAQNADGKFVFNKDERELILRAYNLSFVAHQFYNANGDIAVLRAGHGRIPYIVHPVAVAVSLYDEFGRFYEENGKNISVQAVAAALLHDTLEDTQLKSIQEPNVLNSLLSGREAGADSKNAEKVWNAVRILTRDKETESNTVYLNRVINSVKAEEPDTWDWYSQILLIKLADKLSSIRVDLDFVSTADIQNEKKAVELIRFLETRLSFKKFFADFPYRTSNKGMQEAALYWDSQALAVREKQKERVDAQHGVGFFEQHAKSTRLMGPTDVRLLNGNDPQEKFKWRAEARGKTTDFISMELSRLSLEDAVKYFPAFGETVRRAFLPVWEKDFLSQPDLRAVLVFERNEDGSYSNLVGVYLLRIGKDGIPILDAIVVDAAHRQKGATHVLIQDLRERFMAGVDEIWLDTLPISLDNWRNAESGYLKVKKEDLEITLGLGPTQDMNLQPAAGSLQQKKPTIGTQGARLAEKTSWQLAASSLQQEKSAPGTRGARPASFDEPLSFSQFYGARLSAVPMAAMPMSAEGVVFPVLMTGGVIEFWNLGARQSAKMAWKPAEIPVTEPSDRIFKQVVRDSQVLAQLGYRAALPFKDGRPVKIIRTLDEGVTPDEMHSMALVRQKVKNRFTNVFFEYRSADGKVLVDLSDPNVPNDAMIVETGVPNEDFIKKAEAANKEPGQAGRVMILPLETSGRTEKETGIFPEESVAYGAIIVARGALYERGRQLFARITGNSEFGEAEFNLYQQPNSLRLSDYLRITIKRITIIAIDKFLELTKMATESVGSAA